MRKIKNVTEDDHNMSEFERCANQQCLYCYGMCGQLCGVFCVHDCITVELAKELADPYSMMLHNYAAAILLS